MDVRSNKPSGGDESGGDERKHSMSASQAVIAAASDSGTVARDDTSTVHGDGSSAHGDADGTAVHGRLVTIFGYGSLMREWSALRTFKRVHNYRVALLRGWTRVFSLVSLSAFRNSYANEETGEMAAVALRRWPSMTRIGDEDCDQGAGTGNRGCCEASTCCGEWGYDLGVVGTIFEVDESEVPAYKLREHRYEYATAPVVVIDPNANDYGDTVEALLCVESNDDHYRRKFASEEEYQRVVGSVPYRGPLWHKPGALPARRYMRFCANTAALLSGEAYLSFMNCVGLCDGNASIGQHVATHIDWFPRAVPVVAFVGRSTVGSAMHRIWPAWLEALSLPRTKLMSVDVASLPCCGDKEANDVTESRLKAVVDALVKLPRAIVQGALITAHKIRAWRHLTAIGHRAQQCARACACRRDRPRAVAARALTDAGAGAGSPGPGGVPTVPTGATASTKAGATASAPARWIASVDVEARICQEAAVLSKTTGPGSTSHSTHVHAPDPCATAMSMNHMLKGSSASYWHAHPDAQLVCFGAGGAGTAIVLHVLTGLGGAGFTAAGSCGDNSACDWSPVRATLLPMAALPSKLVVVDCDRGALNRLAHLITSVIEGAGDCVEEGSASIASYSLLHGRIQLVVSSSAAANDTTVSALAPYSMVVNATGLGKSTPGSPLTGDAAFPQHSVVWEMNYRGERQFLRQAMAWQTRHEASGAISVHDGWYAFVQGWSRCVELVYGVELTADQRAVLSATAASVVGRPAGVSACTDSGYTAEAPTAHEMTKAWRAAMRGQKGASEDHVVV